MELYEDVTKRITVPTVQPSQNYQHTLLYLLYSPHRTTNTHHCTYCTALTELPTHITVPTVHYSRHLLSLRHHPQLLLRQCVLLNLATDGSRRDAEWQWDFLSWLHAAQPAWDRQTDRHGRSSHATFSALQNTFRKQGSIRTNYNFKCSSHYSTEVASTMMHLSHLDTSLTLDRHSNRP